MKSILWPSLISNVVNVSLSGGNYWTTCNNFKRYSTLPYCVDATKRIFLDSQILSHRYHFEAEFVGTNILKRSAFYRLNFWQYLFAFLKASFWWFVFLQTPTYAAIHHHKAILLWENVVPGSRTKCAVEKQWILGFQLRPCMTPSKFCLVALATFQITHFDQLGTICNDYSEEYRISGA